MKLTYEEVYQAFLTAIKKVGLENFKKTSMFMSSHKESSK